MAREEMDFEYATFSRRLDRFTPAEFEYLGNDLGLNKPFDDDIDDGADGVDDANDEDDK